MTSLEDYHQDLMADIRREADACEIMTVEAFFERMAARLTEAGEFDTADRAWFQHGEGGHRLRIDGYAGDPRDNEGILGLIVCDFAEGEDVQTFGKTDVPKLLNPLIRFLKKALTEEFRDSLNEVSPAFQVSDLLIATWPQVNKVKLILMSNRHYTAKDNDAVLPSDQDGVPITWAVWDLARFERFDRSGRTREDMVIDFAADFGAPLPALKASQAGSALESYLLIVPGTQLAAIYDRWGARLLEANVRSFLQARAKTNKGIQKTIRDEPELFFPYNNGLSATADGVQLVQSDAGLAIGAIDNLQIVNGAQTTGTIHAALKSAREQLDQVFVQMKLTVVPPDRSEEIVPKISEFANTQNKVNAADFFSNHPFHVRMEQFSRSVMFAAPEGERHDRKWFYERSRGQYINARARLTPAQQKKFDIEFPKSLLFQKTDLAKFEFSATGRPHLVSKGAQKNFADFAKEIGEAWTKSDARFDELWFRRLVAKAIIFKGLADDVAKQAWYTSGFRANIVTYAMAKVFHDAECGGNTLDLDAIWRRQAASEPLKRALLIAAAEANDAITHPPPTMRNMTEWAKQQACWNGFKERRLRYDDDFDGCLTLVETAKTVTREAKAQKSLTDGIVAQSTVVERGAAFWAELLDWGRSHKRLTPKDMQILQVCASMPRQLPSEGQARHALDVLGRMMDQGYGAHAS